MWPRLSLWLFAIGFAPASVRSQDVVATFEGQINYVWDDDNVEAEYLASGQYNPASNVITGIKVNQGVAANPEAAEVFLAVPRWFGGVPSTLNRVTLDLTASGPVQNPLLEPFPSWAMQEVGNCDALQYVQSFEIDNEGNMWVIDTGSVDIFTPNRTNTCPPKLLIINTATGELVDEPYIFPEEVAPNATVFLNDIAVSDTAGGLAYITDMTGNVGGNVGALITYQRTTRTSARFYDPSMVAEPGLSWTFMGRDLGIDTFAQPIEAVALTPDGSRVLYSALQGVNTYSIDTLSLFQNGSDWASTIINHGARQGSTDGFTVDCAGRLFYSDLNSASVLRWDLDSDFPPDESGIRVAQDNDTMWWTDTYAWDDAGYLWTTANYLPALFVDGAFLQANIVRIPTGTGSYQSSSCAAPAYEFDLSPATTYPNLPEQCRGQPPNMLGEFRFFGFRLMGTPAADMTNLADWEEGMETNEIGGIEWVPWQDGPYYLLAINSPAGLVRRVCTFDPWDNRTSTCTGIDYRDEAVTELLYVTEVDEDCRAMSFGIVTTKTFVPGDVCDANAPPGCTAVSNMFVDKVQGVRTQFDYPETPGDMDSFLNRRAQVASNLEDFSPMTTYSNLPEQCRGRPPNMLGEFRFFGFRLEGTPAAEMMNLADWEEGMNSRAIGGIEWVPWQNGPYYLLAINSPAGLVRRVCTFDPWDNRTSTCTGIDYRDEAVTELLYVTEVDDNCAATSFGIVTTKSFVPGGVCDGNTPPGCTAISNMFVDKVQGVRTQFNYPETPGDMASFTRRRLQEDPNNALEDIVDNISPATTYSNLPPQCRGQPPNMLGEFRFFGFRLEGTPAADMTNLADWEEGMNRREIGGIEWVPWQDGPYYMLAINSPAGLVRRICTFDPWDNRTSTCTGIDYRDEAVTELLYVTEVDNNCAATSFGIVTTKSFVPGEECTANTSPPDCTAISNMFVDKVQGVRTASTFPESPEVLTAPTPATPDTAPTPAVVPAPTPGVIPAPAPTPDASSLVIPASDLTLTSSQFLDGGIIPSRYSCVGDDFSPPLSWSGVPDGTQSFVLLLQDADAIPPEMDPPFTRPFAWTHWVMYNIPADVTSLQEAVPTGGSFEGATQGPNAWSEVNGDTSARGIGYTGMCPFPIDKREHTYPFTLYALSTVLGGSGLTHNEVIAAMNGNILGAATLTGHYTRSDFTLTSPVFREGGNIPVNFTCDGDDISPTLSWSGWPAGTASFALTVEDHEAVIQDDGSFSPWTHWIVYNMPVTMTELGQDIPHEASYSGYQQTLNSWGINEYPHSSNGIGYGGMCPNQGDWRRHNYPFTLYALDRMIPVRDDMTYDEFLTAIRGSKLDTAVLNGHYARDPLAPATTPAELPTAEGPALGARSGGSCVGVGASFVGMALLGFAGWFGSF